MTTKLATMGRMQIGVVKGQPVFSIFGGDNLSGYNTFGDIKYVTLDGIDINAMWAEYHQVTDLYNAQRSKLISLFTFPVNNPVEAVPQVGEIIFDEATEFGVPTSARLDLNYFQLGYDFRDYDKASRFTWRFLRDTDSRQVAALHNGFLDADNRLVFRKVMEAIFDNRNRVADIRNQPYNVYPLYNADGTIPPTYKGQVFTNTHSHYLVTGNTAIDSQDVEAAYDHIAEHGFGIEQGTQFIMLANKTEIASIRGWKRGVVSANGAVATYDFIPAANQPAMIVPNSEGLLGSLPPSQWNGLRVTGSYGDILIIEESYIPSGYFMMFGTGGSANLNNLVGLREHQNPQFRGLRLLPGNQSNYPLIESIYSRSFGTGIRQRAGAVIAQIKASGAYDIPSQYTNGGGLS